LLNYMCQNKMLKKKIRKWNKNVEMPSETYVRLGSFHSLSLYYTIAYFHKVFLLYPIVYDINMKSWISFSLW
jgi:hypothetical protein